MALRAEEEDFESVIDTATFGESPNCLFGHRDREALSTEREKAAIHESGSREEGKKGYISMTLTK